MCFTVEWTHSGARGCAGGVRQRAFRRADRTPRALRRRSQRAHTSAARRHAAASGRAPRARAVAEAHDRGSRQRWRQPLRQELRAP